MSDNRIIRRTATEWRAHRERDAQLTVHTVEIDETGALVQVDGELDLGTAAPLWAVLRGHLAAGRRFLRLDVHGVRHLDTTALSEIAVIHREALAARGTLILLGVRPAVARVLSMTGLYDQLFVSGPSIDPDVHLDLRRGLITAP